MKIENMMARFKQIVSLGDHAKKKPEKITGINVSAVLSNLRKQTKNAGTEPFIFAECTEGLPVLDKAITPNKHRDLIQSGDGKMYRISVYPGDPKRMQIEDWDVAEGPVRTLIFEGDSLKEVSKRKKEIRTYVKTDEKTTILIPDDFSAEEQTLFLKEVSGAKVDTEATRRLQEKVLEEKAKAEKARKLQEALPSISHEGPSRN